MRPEAESRMAVAVGIVKRVCVWVAMGASRGSGGKGAGGVQGISGSDWRTGATPGVGSATRMDATPGGEGSPDTGAWQGCFLEGR